MKPLRAVSGAGCHPNQMPPGGGCGEANPSKKSTTPVDQGRCGYAGGFWGAGRGTLWGNAMGATMKALAIRVSLRAGRCSMPDPASDRDGPHGYTGPLARRYRSTRFRSKRSASGSNRADSSRTRSSSIAFAVRLCLFCFGTCGVGKTSTARALTEGVEWGKGKRSMPPSWRVGTPTSSRSDAASSNSVASVS